ncbi:MAG: 50S ribosomal protein L6 [Bacilli bacterium]|nr:50S ribosomal protein L6 [Bacilli bacterium]
MSRIGNRELVIPEGVTVNVQNSEVTVTGKKGSLNFKYKDLVDVEVKEGKVLVTRKNETKQAKQLHGTTNAIISNMLIGVSEGYKKELEINGVGYKFTAQGSKLQISAGYSHQVLLDVPAGLTIECPSNTEVIISGIDKTAVNEFAAVVRRVRKPEPYKGKGIKYKDEFIRRKEGKKAA